MLADVVVCHDVRCLLVSGEYTGADELRWALCILYSNYVMDYEN